MIPLRTAISKTGDAGEALLAAIKLWTLTPQEPVTIDFVRSSDEVITAIANAMTAVQEQIGWPNFFRGFVAKEWGIAGTTGAVTTLAVDEQRELSSETLITYIAAGQTYTLHL